MTLRRCLAVFAAALAGAGVARADDPRLELVERQLAGDHTGAVAVVDALLAQPEAGVARADLAYVRGRLLARLGRTNSAADALARAMEPRGDLAPYARLRLAELQAQMGHPEVAAGLAATLLGTPHPPALAPAATRLLRSALAAGGDCRLLGGLELRGLPARERRQLELARADCELRSGGEDEAVTRLLALLEENLADAAAFDAAERLAGLATAPADGRVERFVGLALHAHREFDRAARHLEQALAGPAASHDGGEYELRYALQRGHFWQGRYRAAAGGFGALARDARDPQRVADALYQEGRSLELVGDWSAAAATFRRSFLAHPRREDAPLALFAALRLEWRDGREAQALEAYRALTARPTFRATAARAALFLAASDLVRGRADRAGAWLAEAEARGAAREESAYWRGRLQELQGQAQGAILAYVESQRAAPHHPLAVAARRRLAGPALAGPARALGLRLARGSAARDLEAAWLLLGDGHPAGSASREALATLLQADRRAAPFLTLEEVPAARWPIFARPLSGTEERLLGLGQVEDGAPAVLAHFPVSEPRLAYTGARLLAGAGETRRALLIAELLGDRGAERLPAGLLPAGYRRLLYPRPYDEELRSQAARQGVDVHLLTAVLREESRFDPRALSAAAARGLAQFVLPTARRLAAQLGMAEFTAADLDRPEVSIALAAAYLRELDQLFPGASHMAVAAYNAGEPQAILWRSYCYSSEPEEYLTKIAFRETRAYVARVLASREHYAELLRLAFSDLITDSGQLVVHAVEVVDHVGLAPQLLGPALQLLVEPLLLEHRADALAHLFERRRRLALTPHLGHQGRLVIAPGLVQADEDAHPQPLLDVGEHHELARHEIAHAVLVHAELREAGAEGRRAREPAADLGEARLDLAHRHLGEAVAVDFVEAQPLLDHLVEHPPAQGSIVLAGLALGEPKTDRPLDVGGQDGVLVHHRQDAVGELRLRGRGECLEIGEDEEQSGRSGETPGGRSRAHGAEC